MYCAVITGDIIASTSLSIQGREILESNFKKLFKVLDSQFNVYGKNSHGDYIECVIPDPHDALRVALIIKAFIKSITMPEDEKSSPTIRSRKYFSHGIRLVIGFGELKRFDPANDIIDGEAIYMASRKIKEYSTYDKERIIIKESIYLVSSSMEKYEAFEPMIGLIDELITRATSKQCRVLYLKLLGNTEISIAKQLNIVQSAVNKHSTGVAWNAIEKAVNYFEEKI